MRMTFRTALGPNVTGAAGLAHDPQPVHRLAGRTARVEHLEGDVVAPEDDEEAHRPERSGDPARARVDPHAEAQHEQRAQRG